MPKRIHLIASIILHVFQNFFAFQQQKKSIDFHLRKKRFHVFLPEIHPKNGSFRCKKFHFRCLFYSFSSFFDDQQNFVFYWGWKSVHYFILAMFFGALKISFYWRINGLHKFCWNRWRFNDQFEQYDNYDKEHYRRGRVKLPIKN